MLQTKKGDIWRCSFQEYVKNVSVKAKRTRHDARGRTKTNYNRAPEWLRSPKNKGLIKIYQFLGVFHDSIWISYTCNALPDKPIARQYDYTYSNAVTQITSKKFKLHVCILYLCMYYFLFRKIKTAFDDYVLVLVQTTIYDFTKIWNVRIRPCLQSS